MGPGGLQAKLPGGSRVSELIVFAFKNETDAAKMRDKLVELQRFTFWRWTTRPFWSASRMAR